MSNKKNIEIDLYKYFNVEKKVDGGILKGSIHFAENKPLILVIPGGAYSFLCFRENTPFVNRFGSLSNVGMNLAELIFKSQIAISMGGYPPMETFCF